MVGRRGVTDMRLFQYGVMDGILLLPGVFLVAWAGGWEWGSWGFLLSFGVLAWYIFSKRYQGRED